MAAVANRSKAV